MQTPDGFGSGQVRSVAVESSSSDGSRTDLATSDWSIQKPGVGRIGAE